MFSYFKLSLLMFVFTFNYSIKCSSHKFKGTAFSAYLNDAEVMNATDFIAFQDKVDAALGDTLKVSQKMKEAADKILLEKAEREERERIRNIDSFNKSVILSSLQELIEEGEFNNYYVQDFGASELKELKSVFKKGIRSTTKKMNPFLDHKKLKRAKPLYEPKTR